MSGEAQWNLDSLELPKLDVLQITVSEECLDESPEVTELRLLILSHSLAYRKNIAIFCKQCPQYTPYASEGPVIMLFDVDGSSSEYSFPFWANIDKWSWDPKELYNEQIADDFQHAITLFHYYKLSEYQPLYFTSFLLIQSDLLRSEPFIIQMIPVLKDGKIRLRTLLQDNLDMIIDPPLPIKNGSYVLIPPFINPFLAVENHSNSITFLQENKETITFDPKYIRMVKLCSPPEPLLKYFEYEPNQFRKINPAEIEKSPTPKIIGCFKTKEYFELDENDLLSFFTKPAEVEQKEEQYYIDFPAATSENIISSQETNPDAIDIILKALGKYDFPPSIRYDTTLVIASFLSFFRFDFGFPRASPPPHLRSLANSTQVMFERLPVPHVKVNEAGQLRSVSATTVIRDWQQKRYMPISGEKSSNFVVFCDSSLGFTQEALSTFMSQFCHQYASLGFGQLKELPKTDPYFFAPQNHLPEKIERFFKDESTAEFQAYPITSFVIGAPIFKPGFVPHSVITYVRPRAVLHATEEDIKTLAFVVYSRIRTLDTTPYGRYMMTMSPTATLFFGFRYSPPFVLEGPADQMTMHIAWDPVARLIAWVDNVGTVLQVMGADGGLPTIILYVRDLMKLIRNITLRFTFSILAEVVEAETVAAVRSEFAGIPVEVFSVYPAAAVQVTTSDPAPGDLLVWSTPEAQFGNGGRWATPVESAFVLSPSLPGYSVHLFQTTGDPRDAVRRFAKGMSELSWCSVKPQCENRTLAYPPHMAALLRKNNCSTRVCGEFEFLPLREKI